MVYGVGVCLAGKPLPLVSQEGCCVAFLSFDIAVEPVTFLINPKATSVDQVVHISALLSVRLHSPANISTCQTASAWDKYLCNRRRSITARRRHHLQVDAI
ncbi:hypothetical protein HN011_005741 [Eciton burchellii]|nr:hypothetical protein HN011_005741 [Eciton burchellii]